MDLVRSGIDCAIIFESYLSISCRCLLPNHEGLAATVEFFEEFSTDHQAPAPGVQPLNEPRSGLSTLGTEYFVDDVCVDYRAHIQTPRDRRVSSMKKLP